MKRCGFTAMAEHRLWVCCFPRGHEGNCFASRYDVERAFWEDWEAPVEQTETETEYLLRVYGPNGTEKVAAIVPPSSTEPIRQGVTGRRRTPKTLDNVYGGFMHDGVKSAVTWNGRKVLEHPTLDQLDGGLVWR